MCIQIDKNRSPSGRLRSIVLGHIARSITGRLAPQRTSGLGWRTRSALAAALAAFFAISSAVSAAPPRKSGDTPKKAAAPSKTTPVSPGKAETPPAPRAPEEYCLLIEPADGPAVKQAIKGAERTALVPGRETSIGVRYYTEAEFAALKLGWTGFQAKAAESADRVLAHLKPEWVKDEKGFVRYAVLKSPGQLTASTVFGTKFRALFREAMGDELVLLIPDRSTVYVFPRSMGEYKDFGKKILLAYADAVYPVSYEVFLLNRDGLSCLGSFNTGDE